MRNVTLPCSHCNGSGKRLLTGIYAETLDLLRKNPRSTGATLAKVAGCKPTAMNNRLASLERLGLVSSERFGRERIYTAKG